MELQSNRVAWQSLIMLHACSAKLFSLLIPEAVVREKIGAKEGGGFVFLFCSGGVKLCYYCNESQFSCSEMSFWRKENSLTLTCFCTFLGRRHYTV